MIVIGTVCYYLLLFSSIMTITRIPLSSCEQQQSLSLSVMTTFHSFIISVCQLDSWLTCPAWSLKNWSTYLQISTICQDQMAGKKEKWDDGSKWMSVRTLINSSKCFNFTAGSKLHQFIGGLIRAHVKPQSCNCYFRTNFTTVTVSC